MAGGCLFVVVFRPRFWDFVLPVTPRENRTKKMRPDQDRRNDAFEANPGFGFGNRSRGMSEENNDRRWSDGKAENRKDRENTSARAFGEFLRKSLRAARRRLFGHGERPAALPIQGWLVIMCQSSPSCAAYIWKYCLCWMSTARTMLESSACPTWEMKLGMIPCCLWA